MLFANITRYAIDKPTYNEIERIELVYQTSSQFSLIYDILLVPQISNNQIISSVNIQIGSVIDRTKMKYTSGKRLHLELVFITQEAVNSWEDKPLTIGRQTVIEHKALSSKRSFFSVALSRISLRQRQENLD
jgi:hypothetical protein